MKTFSKKLTLLALSLFMALTILTSVAPTSSQAASTPQAAAQCDCIGRHDVDLGASTLKVYISSCKVARLVNILETTGDIGKVLEFIRLIPGYEALGELIDSVASTLKKAGKQIKAAGASGQGVLIKFRVKTFDYTVNPQATLADTFGQVETPRVNALLTPGVMISGWVRMKYNCVDHVEVWIDGQFRSNSEYGLSRPDTQGGVGFQYLWGAKTASAHQIQVKVVAKYGGYVNLIPAVGTTNVTTIPVTVTDVQGWVETIRPNDTVTKPVLLKGWAKIPGMNVQSVEIVVDGTSRGFATYGTSRPDTGGNYGWEFVWPARTSGPHVVQIKVTASNGYTKFLPALGTSVTSIPVTVR